MPAGVWALLPLPLLALTRVPERSAWAAQVLRWMGYFRESVPQSPAEDFRVRRVEVHLSGPSNVLGLAPSG